MIRIEANPNYYGYIHYIDLFPNGKCIFMDGVGQSININTKGTYTQTFDNALKTKGKFNFTVNEIRFQVSFIVVTGLFVLMNEIIWDSNVEDWPFSVCKTRYVFEEDPFNKLYITKPEEDITKRIFYLRDNIVEKPAKYLSKNELYKVQTPHPIFYGDLLKIV